MTVLFGTNVMFYEEELVEEYCRSIRHALQSGFLELLGIYIKLDFLINTDVTFERPINKNISDIEVKINSTIIGILGDLQSNNVEITLRPSRLFDPPYTMVNYRRDLNSKCLKYDLVVWGETDCLLPKTFFRNLLSVYEYAEAHNIKKYVITFSDRKMWDETWKVLEHPDFTNKPYYERDDPRSKTEKHSIRYTLNQEDLDVINYPYEDDIEIKILRTPKFDGSLLCISSELILQGVNIPLGYWGLSGEDEVMMYQCSRIMGSRYIQFVISNICKGHNREHPNKRKNIESTLDLTPSTQSSKGSWYNVLRDMNKANIGILFGPPSEETELFSYYDYKIRVDGLHSS